MLKANVLNVWISSLHLDDRWTMVREGGRRAHEHIRAFLPGVADNLLTKWESGALCPKLSNGVLTECARELHVSRRRDPPQESVGFSGINARLLVRVIS